MPLVNVILLKRPANAVTGLVNVPFNMGQEDIYRDVDGQRVLNNLKGRVVVSMEVIKTIRIKYWVYESGDTPELTSFQSGQSTYEFFFPLGSPSALYAFEVYDEDDIKVGETGYFVTGDVIVLTVDYDMFSASTLTVDTNSLNQGCVFYIDGGDETPTLPALPTPYFSGILTASQTDLLGDIINFHTTSTSVT